MQREHRYYTRTCADETLLVVANKSDQSAALRLPEPIRSARWRRILTNLNTPSPPSNGHL